MYRKIIVGYKADRHGEDALALARVLSSPDSVQHVFVVQAGDDSSDGPGERDVSAGWPAHVSVSVRAAAGSSPAEALGSMAAELGADLVVLGSTHRGFVGRILLGTTADHIAADSDLTFVVAPEGFQGTAIRKIGIAFDGSGGADSAFAWGTDVAAHLSARLCLIGVVEPPPPPVETWGANVPGEAWADGLSLTRDAELVDVVRARMRSMLDAAASSAAGPPVETAMPVGEAVQELRDAATELDMLVVGSHDHGRLARAMGSVAHGLTRSCPAPLAVVAARGKNG